MNFRPINEWHWHRIIYVGAVFGILTYFAITPN